MIYHTFKLDANVLVDEYPDWSDKSFEPFTKCLEDINVCLPIFKKFVSIYTQNDFKTDKDV